MSVRFFSATSATSAGSAGSAASPDSAPHQPGEELFGMRMRMRIRSVGVALRYAESVLLAPGQQHARRNAWAAVCENRRYAADRRHDDAEAARSTPRR
ncbi:hypothetical protein ACFU6K_06585 [Kitasatospora sp. NPDC057512]|uniref:hypothetical protein n=1 Tax=Kitasatospora sp. NPDC057512 TaxID=3346154 RepID=UPI0036CE8921